MRTGSKLGERGSSEKIEGEQVYISGIKCVSSRNKVTRFRSLVLLIGIALNEFFEWEEAMA